MIENSLWNGQHPRRKVRLRGFTLVELLVSLTLLSLILMVLLGGYRQVVMVKQRLQIQRQEAFEKRYFLARLTEIFASIQPKSNGNQHFFHTSFREESQIPALVFTYDNKVDLKPYFSGNILGKLYLDREKNLCLASWPLPSDKEPDYRMKHEILLSKVKDMSWSFYVPPSKELPVGDGLVIQKGAKEVDPPERDFWDSAWQENYRGLPPIARLRIRREEKKEPQEYYFLLPATQTHIKY